jgi:hypothetical protein
MKTIILLLISGCLLAQDVKMFCNGVETGSAKVGDVVTFSMYNSSGVLMDGIIDAKLFILNESDTVPFNPIEGNLLNRKEVWAKIDYAYEYLLVMTFGSSVYDPEEKFYKQFSIANHTGINQITKDSDYIKYDLNGVKTNKKGVHIRVYNNGQRKLWIDL